MKSRKRVRTQMSRTILGTFELKFPSLPKNIAEVERFLERIGRKIRLDDGTMYRLRIATTEAVNNAILHGNQSDPTKNVLVFCRATKTCLTIRVRDDGPGFNADDLPNPLDEKNLMKEHGRGVFLIKSMMDQVTFRRLKRGWIVSMRICYNR